MPTDKNITEAVNAIVYLIIFFVIIGLLIYFHNGILCYLTGDSKCITNTKAGKDAIDFSGHTQDNINQSPSAAQAANEPDVRKTKLAVAQPASTSNLTVPKMKRIQWGDSGKCLDVKGGKDQNGTKIQVWGCEETNASQNIQYNDGQIQWGESGKCFDVEEGLNLDGTNIQLWECNRANKNQIFKYENGRIQWGNSGKCLYVRKNENGINILLWTCKPNDDTSQKFNIV